MKWRWHKLRILCNTSWRPSSKSCLIHYRQQRICGQSFLRRKEKRNIINQLREIHILCQAIVRDYAFHIWSKLLTKEKRNILNQLTEIHILNLASTFTFKAHSNLPSTGIFLSPLHVNYHDPSTVLLISIFLIGALKSPKHIQFVRYRYQYPKRVELFADEWWRNHHFRPQTIQYCTILL